MSRTIMLIPTSTSVGLTSVSLGVIRSMEQKGVRLSVFKPIAQPRTGGASLGQPPPRIRAYRSIPAPEPQGLAPVEQQLSPSPPGRGFRLGFHSLLRNPFSAIERMTPNVTLVRPTVVLVGFSIIVSDTIKPLYGCSTGRTIDGWYSAVILVV